MKKSRSEIYSKVVFFLLICLCAVCAWSLRFLQDDAFISFRYASNLVGGHGLVFNPGEWVEGYSNFLWTLILAAVMWCGAEPEFAAQVLGIVFYVAHLLVLARFGLELSLSRISILCVVAIVGLNYSFAAYATGGLETSLHAFLITCVARHCVRFLNPKKDKEEDRNLLLIGVFSSLALLARMDSAVFLFPLVGSVALRVAQRPLWLRKISMLVILPIASLVIWSLWRHWVYGEWLPNTFYVKLASHTSWVRGISFLGLFFSSYLLYLPVILLLGFCLLRYRNLHSPSLLGSVAMLFGALILWLGYVVYAGGDFMEFRILVPSIPLMALLLFLVAEWLTFSQVLKIALTLSVAIGSLHHASTFAERERSENVLSIALLSSQVADEESGWRSVGIDLGQLFAGQSSPIIAVTAAGALPYYSGLEAIDMFGLTDAWVARHGTVIGSTPGHQRFVSMDYLTERRVQLVIPFPKVVERGKMTPGAIPSLVCNTPFWSLLLARRAELPAEARGVLLPLSGSRDLLAIQFIPEQTIDRLVASGRAHAFELPGEC